MRNIIIHYYEEIYSKLNMNMSFVFRPKDNQLKQIDNFIAFIEKEIGKSSIDEGFLFDYLVFQFEKRKDQKTRFGVGKIPINHVIGQKSWEKWIRKPSNWKYWSDVFINEYHIEKPTVKESKLSTLNINNQEENVKEYYLKNNKENVLFFCCEFTTLFHPQSTYCDKCGCSRECKSMLQDIYPKLYESRKKFM